MDLPAGNDRRRGRRHLASLPVHERFEGSKPRTAMVRELSVTGAQILTQSRREVGSELSLELFFEEDAPPRQVQARVVRAEPLAEPGIWRHLTVVEFAEPLSDLEAEIREIAENQEKIFGPRGNTSP